MTGTARFLAGGGATGALIRTRDWSSTTLGLPQHWPQPLTTLVEVMLSANQPMFVAWGPDRTILYNDAYAEILKTKHPAALGSRFFDVWAEIRSDLEPLVAQVDAGKPVHSDDITLVLHRRGYLEETHFSFSYTPVRDETGAVAGFFCPCTETTGQVMAERRTADETRRQRRMFEQAPGFICTLQGPKHVFEFVNNAYKRLFGDRNLVGKSVREGFPDLEGQGFYELLDKVYATGERFVANALPIRLRATPEAELADRFLDFIYEPMLDEVGDVTGIFVEGYEVTERVRAEAGLRDAEERYLALFNAIDQGFCTIEVAFDEQGVALDYRFLEVSPSFQRQTGIENGAGRWMREIAADQEQFWFDTYGRVALTGEPARFENYSTPLDRWFDVYAFRISGPRRIAVLFRDITDQKRANAALRESEARFRLMADAVPQIVWITDVQGRAEFFNKQWLDYTGFAYEPTTAAEVAANHVHPNDATATVAAFDEARRTGTTFLIEHRIRSKTDVYRWFLVRGEPYRNPLSGEVVRWFGASVDIHDRKLAEAALRTSEARHRFRAELSDALRGLTTPSEIMSAVAERLGLHLGTDQANYYSVEGDRFVVTEEWRTAASAGMLGSHALADFGEGTLALIRSGGVLRLDDTRDAEGAQAYAAAGMSAVLSVPLRRGHHWAGGLHVHQKQPRVWRDEEAALVAEVAARTWDAIERARAEDELRASEARFREFGEAASDTLWIIDAATEQLEYLSPAFERIWGEPRANVMTDIRRWAEFLHPDDREVGLSAMPRALAGQRVTNEYRIVRADGEVRWILDVGFPILDEAGRVMRVGGIAQDRTERRLAEEALRRSEWRLRELNETLERRVAERTTELSESQRRFQGIFNSALQFMALLTPAGTVVEVNETALARSQITPSDIVGKPFWLAAPMRGNTSLQAAIQAGIQRAAAGETVREEHEMRGAGEVRAIVDFSLKPVLGERGEAIWVVAEGRDITDLKRAQDQLRQAQKLEAVGQLTGGVAHDFNNLLTIIRSSTDLLRKPDLAEERRRRYVDAIADTVDRAAKLTGQLLAFARRQALKPEVFDPAQRLRLITDMLRTVVGARIEIVTEVACEACFVEADASQFETALVNIAVNARDAMNGEGRLALSVEDKGTLPLIRGHAGGKGRFVAVSITDTGAGIPQDKLTQIFEPFFTTKEVGKGTGLGLSQVYGFAKQSGGDVAVESEVGRGTTFTLYLPRADEAAATECATEAKDSPSIEDGRGHRVLVVEDNVDVGTFSTQLLQDLGYDTTWAANAVEALQLLSEVNGFDVVFSDVVMPGMTGVELGHEIRRRYPGLPIVLTSGYSHVLAEEGRHGFELLQKPYAAEELSRVLRRVMHQRSCLLS